ncbi:MAG: DUF4383 domain-containing protein [Thermoleophilia bacterium]|nr:DUF4383 domain-containing protein [Thermoleophilia bacterium]GIK77553.1 MAG: hypothetical protein BroJett022_12430 [Actinomycetes bacterium]
MADRSDRGAPKDAAAPGPARLYALCAGAFLALLGVVGFFFDAGFETGRDLAADDVAGTIAVNGWRNLVYLGTGLLSLALAPRHARAAATALGGFYLLLGVWGLAVTDHDIGSILGLLPLTDEDNVLHLVLGGLGAVAAAADGPLPRRSGSRRGSARPRRGRAREPKRPAALDG